MPRTVRREKPRLSAEALWDFAIKTLASGDNFFFGDITWLK